MKLVSLKKSAGERKADEKDGMVSGPYGGDDGVTVHLEPHHLEKLGLGGKLKSGHKFKIEGRGHVEESESRSGKEGERHSARLRITHAGVEHKDADGDNDGDMDERGAEKSKRNADIAKAYEASESKRK